MHYTPVHTFATLDDDLYGARASDNQVKTLSARKADREGNTADAMADALFRVTLMIMFRRRGEGQSANVSNLIGTLLEGGGEQSLHGLIITADRGYGSFSLIQNLLTSGIGSIVIMPEHLLRCHTFVGETYFRCTRNDEEQEDSCADRHINANGIERPQAEAQEGSENVISGNASEAADAENERYTTSNEGVTETTAVQTVFDRRRTFVIDDSPSTGPSSFFAIQSVRTSGGSATGTSQVTAVAVWEQGTKHFNKIIRFMYSVPSTISRSIETWIAVPRTAPVAHLLFSKRDDHGRVVLPDFDSSNEKDVIERLVRQKCCLLTIG